MYTTLDVQYMYMYTCSFTCMFCILYMFVSYIHVHVHVCLFVCLYYYHSGTLPITSTIINQTFNLNQKHYVKKTPPLPSSPHSSNLSLTVLYLYLTLYGCYFSLLSLNYVSTNILPLEKVPHRHCSLPWLHMDHSFRLQHGKLCCGRYVVPPIATPTNNSANMYMYG